MTLSETLIVGAGLGFVLILVSLFVDANRTELKRRQMWALLGTLDRAIEAYHTATGTWPTGTTEDAAEPVVALLQAEASSGEILQQVPSVLRIPTKSDWTVQDAWGRGLHCLTAASRSGVDREAVAANGGKPIFISASADGEFRSKHGGATADNLRSDELPR